MESLTKKWAAIVGGSVIAVGIIAGGTYAASASTLSGASTTTHSIHLKHGADDATATPTPSATTEPGDDNGDDSAVSPAVPVTPSAPATAEPGDDDAPGTADHHGGKTGTDDDGTNGAEHSSGHHRGSDDAAGSDDNSGSSSKHSGSDDGASHDSSDDNGSHSGSDDSGSDDGGHHGGHGSDD